MDSRQLEIFITSAQYLNFTKASKHLNMVPSNVSHSISMLERELNTKLFTRKNNKLSLTESGKNFLNDAIRINTIMNNAIHNCGSEVNAPKDMLTMGVVFPEFMYNISDQMRVYFEENVNVDLHCLQFDSIKLVNMLSECKIDVALARQEMFSADPEVEWRSLYKDPFYLVTHRSNPLANEKKITVPMLKNETIIMMNRQYNPGMYDMIQHLFLSNKIIPKVYDYCNSHLTSLLLASFMKGSVIIPKQNICHLKLYDGLVCRKIDNPCAYHEIGVAWNKKNMTPVLDGFLRALNIEI